MKKIEVEKILNRIDSKNTLFYNGILSEIKKDNYTFPAFETVFSTDHKTFFTSQGKTGYCWLLSSLQCVEHFVCKKYDKENIHFSREHLIFWDKIEKANWFLEQILLRLPWNPEDRAIRYLLSRAMSDRGQWSMARNLIEKYGLVPIETSETIRGTGELNACLSMLLRSAAATLHNAFENGNTQNILEQLKEDLLIDVSVVLCEMYGAPTKSVSLKDFFPLEKTKQVSPKELYERAVAFPFDDYISVFNDGVLSDGYSVDTILLDTNMVGGRSPSFLHVKDSDFYKGILRQVSDGEPCWFTCDAGKFNFKELGYFDDELFEFGKISSILAESLTKTTINRYSIAGMTHSMVMQQTRNIDSKRWWQAYDSAEYRSSTNFMCYLSDSWFRKYVFQAVIHRNFLDVDLYEVTNHKTVNPWDFFNLGNI